MWVVLERILADRMHYLCAKNGLISPLQAGFRKGRSIEDQILKIVQSIEDGFQHKDKMHSILVLLDFSKAYGTVWREKILLNLLDKSIPHVYVKWLKGFLENRQVKVRFGGKLSFSQCM